MGHQNDKILVSVDACALASGLLGPQQPSFGGEIAGLSCTFATAPSTGAANITSTFAATTPSTGAGNITGTYAATAPGKLCRGYYIDCRVKEHWHQHT